MRIDHFALWQRLEFRILLAAFRIVLLGLVSETAPSSTKECVP